MDQPNQYSPPKSDEENEKDASPKWRTTQKNDSIAQRSSFISSRVKQQGPEAQPQISNSNSPTSLQHSPSDNDLKSPKNNNVPSLSKTNGLTHTSEYEAKMKKKEDLAQRARAHSPIRKGTIKGRRKKAGQKKNICQCLKKKKPT